METTSSLCQLDVLPCVKENNGLEQPPRTADLPCLTSNFLGESQRKISPLECVLPTPEAASNESNSFKESPKQGEGMVGNNPSAEPIKRKRGRPPKNKSPEQWSPGLPQPLSEKAPEINLQSNAPETKVPETQSKTLEKKLHEISSPKSKSPKSKTKSSDNDSPVEKRSRGRPPKVRESRATADVQIQQGLYPSVEPVKRKRGRPPKNKYGTSVLYEISSPKSKSPQSKIKSSDNDSPVEKQRRGRPPKVLESCATADVQIQQGLYSSAEPVKRKRGRPPKNKYGTSVLYGISSSKSKSPKSKIKSSDNDSPVEKRRRGRPPKVLESCVTADVQIQQGLYPSAEPVKRKRGRPPKNKYGTSMLYEICSPKSKSPKSKIKSSDNDSPVEKRRRGQPPNVRESHATGDLQIQRGLYPSTVPVKLKRGRLPKNKYGTSVLYGISSSKSKSPKSKIKSSDNDSPVEKRRRGRPPKVRESRATADAQIQRGLYPSAEPVKRKRGRPPKNKFPEQRSPGLPQPLSEKATEINLQSKAPEKKVPETQRKTLERKVPEISTPKNKFPKSKIKSSENDSPVEKRRRGRPPKVRESCDVPPKPSASETLAGIPAKHLITELPLKVQEQPDMTPKPAIESLIRHPISTSTSTSPGVAELTSSHSPSYTLSKAALLRPTADSPPKRKRGRPPKNPPSPHVETVPPPTSTSDQETSTEKETPAPPVRKQRR